MRKLKSLFNLYKQLIINELHFLQSFQHTLLNHLSCKRLPIDKLEAFFQKHQTIGMSLKIKLKR
jgi:hypothetical protein